MKPLDEPRGRATDRRRRIAFGLWAVVLLGVGFASAAEAQSVRLYATLTPQDSTYHGPLIVSGDRGTTVYLWLEGGSATSSAAPCAPGMTGDELCGYSFVLDASPTYVMSDYNGDPAFDTSGDGGVPPFALSATGDRLSSNAFDLGTPPLANRYLGSLTVTPIGPGPLDSISASGSVLTAGLALAPITPGDLIVPEPGFGVGLAGCAGVLLAWARRRALRA